MIKDDIFLNIFGSIDFFFLIIICTQTKTSFYIISEKTLIKL